MIPELRETVVYSTFFFNIIFTTPAIASDPYCAEAPSRKTSILSIAAVGILFISVPTSPFPGVSFT